MRESGGTGTWGPALMLFAGLLFAGLPAFAQRALTLEDCLRQAREASIALRLNDRAVRSVTLAETELRSTALPQVRAAAGASHAPVHGVTGYDPAVTEGGQLSGQVVVQESVFDGGVRAFKSGQNELELQRLENERRLADHDLVYSVTALFVEALRAQEETRLQQAAAQQLEDYLALAERMARGGTGSQTDVLRTQVQLNNARLSVNKAVQDEVMARISLAEAMGTPADTGFAVSGSLTVTPDSISAAVPLDTTFENVELRMAKLEMEKGLLDVRIAERERWPTVSLTGDAGWLTSVNNLRLPPGERISPFGYSVGIGLEMPLFTWGGIGSRIEQRQVAAEIQRLTIEQLSRSTRRELLGVLSQMRNTLATIRSLDATIHAAEDNFILTKSKFAGGGALSIEVLSAQQLLADSRVAELQARASWKTLQAKLAQLTAQ